MSYRNPKYTYISDAKAVTDMQANLAQSVAVGTQKKEAAEKEEVAQKKADRMNSAAWNDQLLAVNPDGDQFNQGILNSTYADSGKRYAELKRMIADDPGSCEEETCDKENAELAKIKGQPALTMDFLGRFSTEIATLDEENIDVNQPKYKQLTSAKNIIDGIEGYGKGSGYDMKVTLNDDGTQQLTFTGEEFGPDGWSINSGRLTGIQKGGGGIAIGGTDWATESAAISENSNWLDKNLTDKDGAPIGINTDFESIQMGDYVGTNGEEFNEETLQTTIDALPDTCADPNDKACIPKINPDTEKPWTPEEFATASGMTREPKKRLNTNGEQENVPEYDWKEEWVYDEAGGRQKQRVPYPKFNIEKIRQDIMPEVKAEVSAMFGIEATGEISPEGANEAFANWNAPKPGFSKNVPEELQGKPWFTEDGLMNYDSLDATKCPVGSECSVYIEDGKYKPEVIEDYEQVYADFYMSHNVNEYIKKASGTPISPKLVPSENVGAYVPPGTGIWQKKKNGKKPNTEFNSN